MSQEADSPIRHQRDPINIAFDIANAALVIAAEMQEQALSAETHAAQMEQNYEIAKNDASIDDLTGVYLRKGFIDACNKPKVSQSRINREEAHNSLLFIDIDHFKQINDSKGHDAGDAVLVEFVKRTKSAVREDDIIGRWGGDEFVVFLPETGEEGALRVASKLLNEVTSSPMNGLDVTISVGAAEVVDGNLQLGQKQADAAAYAAKDSGRNQAIGFSNLKPG